MCGGTARRLTKSCSRGVVDDVQGVPKTVTLKVGGMGLNLFDGHKLLESHLYFGMRGWNFSPAKGTFDLQFKDEAIGKIKFGTAQVRRPLRPFWRPF
jgi:hypothetical protein